MGSWVVFQAPPLASYLPGWIVGHYPHFSDGNTENEVPSPMPRAPKSSDLLNRNVAVGVPLRASSGGAICVNGSWSVTRPGIEPRPLLLGHPPSTTRPATCKRCLGASGIGGRNLVPRTCAWSATRLVIRGAVSGRGGTPIVVTRSGDRPRRE